MPVQTEKGKIKKPQLWTQQEINPQDEKQWTEFTF